MTDLWLFRFALILQAPGRSLYFDFRMELNFTKSVWKDSVDCIIKMLIDSRERTRSAPACSSSSLSATLAVAMRIIPLLADIYISLGTQRWCWKKVPWKLSHWLCECQKLSLAITPSCGTLIAQNRNWHFGKNKFTIITTKQPHRKPRPWNIAHVDYDSEIIRPRFIIGCLAFVLFSCFCRPIKSASRLTSLIIFALC